jgi:hypothetical protein
MNVHDLVERVPSERARRLLHVTFQVTQDPVPDWLHPGQTAAAGALLVGFAGLLLVPLPAWLWSLLITLGALGTLVLRLLSLRWAPALAAGPWPLGSRSGGFSVTVTGPGPAPIRAIKAVRDLTGVSLQTAHHAVMSAPTTLLADVDEAEATRAADVLRAAGAEVAVATNDAVEQAGRAGSADSAADA